MAGAIAGTAILNIDRPQNSLHTVTATVNNYCNLNCPHCYLQYDGPSSSLSSVARSAILHSNFKHLAIVGKEPLAGREATRVTTGLIESVVESGKTVSLITNGHGLSNLPKSAIQRLAYIDVSFDGGPMTYSTYRKGDLAKVLKGVQRLNNIGFECVNALHTLSSANLEFVADMLAISRSASFGTIMFSPYLSTRNDGLNSVNSTTLVSIMDTLLHCAEFMHCDSAFLLIDMYHLQQDNISSEELQVQIKDRPNFDRKVRLMPEDPLAYGIVRVTYDGKVLTPTESLNPSDYHKIDRNIDSVATDILNLYYQNMVEEFAGEQVEHADKEPELLLG